ncbi:MAG TPA: CapA family protein [Gemmatimonadales bacterium]|nr:CapA family protein [Gemmatimonadales bacterium]
MSQRAVALVALVAAAAARPVAAQDAPARGPLHVILVGDVNFARGIARDYVLAGKGDSIFAEVADTLRAADLAIGNLESILLDRGDTTDPTGKMVFAGPGIAAPLLADAGFAAVSTANNHAWDFGRHGLLESLRHLDAAGILHSGTGPTLDDAYRPAILDRAGWRVALFGVTDIVNLKGLVLTGTPAACCIAWADTAVLGPRMRAARDSLGADLVLVMIHGGNEYRERPPAALHALMRGLILAGADAVIGHHPHVLQGAERFHDRPIAYSLGNFVFRQPFPWTDKALLAELTAEPRGPVTLTLRPVYADYVPRFASGPDSTAILARVDTLSRWPARVARGVIRRGNRPPPPSPPPADSIPTPTRPTPRPGA